MEFESEERSSVNNSPGDTKCLHDHLEIQSESHTGGTSRRSSTDLQGMIKTYKFYYLNLFP